jgi:prepilin-type N-terminal cleavage/methylation domain-containing protein
MRTERGFTLLEVMVATAILGLTLTVILSAEGGLAATNKSTANVGTAISLARCKMVEAEDKILRFGFPMVDDLQSDQPCCNDEEVPGFKCDMRTELIMMPNPPTTKLDGGGLSLSASASPSEMLPRGRRSHGLSPDPADGGKRGRGSGLALDGHGLRLSLHQAHDGGVDPAHYGDRPMEGRSHAEGVLDPPVRHEPNQRRLWPGGGRRRGGKLPRVVVDDP